LADAAVNTNYVAAFLIDDGVQNDGGFAGLAVADDQFALAAANRNHRVDSLDAGLQRLANGLAVEHTGGDAFERIALLRKDGTLSVERFAERIHHAADEGLPHGNGHNGIGALDDVALFQFGRLAKKHGADFFLFEVQRDAENVFWEGEHFAGHDFFEAVNTRDAVADADDRADFVDGNGLLVVLDLLAQDLADFVRFYIRHPAPVGAGLQPGKPLSF